MATRLCCSRAPEEADGEEQRVWKVGSMSHAFVCRENGGFKCQLDQPGHREPFRAEMGTKLRLAVATFRMLNFWSDWKSRELLLEGDRLF